MTMEAWVRPTASTNWRTILLKESSNDLAYSMYSASGTNRPSAWISRRLVLRIGRTPAEHLVTRRADVRRSAAQALRQRCARFGHRLYRRGPVTANPLKLGGNEVWGEYFAGQLDEVRLYNRVRTATEIQTDMNTPI